METIKYKGFIGSVEVSISDNCLYGKILFINDLVTYEANSLDEIEKEFKDAVDDHIETCKELGIEAHKSFSGSFNVRIGPEMHEALAMLSIKSDKAMNVLMKEAAQQYLYDKKDNPAEVHNHFHQTIFQPYEEFDPYLGVDPKDMHVESTFTKKQVN